VQSVIVVVVVVVVLVVEFSAGRSRGVDDDDEDDDEHEKTGTGASAIVGGHTRGVRVISFDEWEPDWSLRRGWAGPGSMAGETPI